MSGGRRALRPAIAWAATGALCLALGSVAAAQQTITATEGQGFSGEVATVSTDCSSLAPGSGSIDWGDQTTSAAQLTVSGSELVVSGSHTYVEEGQYAGTASGSYSCNGRAASFTAGSVAQIADAPVYASGGLQLTASATDQSFSGRVATISLAEDPRSYTATIDWGDGSSSAGTVTPCGGTFCVGTDFVSGSHQYPAKAANYTITVAILDDGGQTASVKDTITVSRPPPCPPLSWGGPYSQPPYSVANELQLSSPQPIVDQNGNPTGRYSQTLWVLLGDIAAVTPGCWYAVGDAGPPATGEAYEPTVHFLTFSGVAINGVYYIPESPDSLLVLGTDGTLVAGNLCGLVAIRGLRLPAARAHAAGCNPSTYYDIEVPENGSGGGPLTPVGRIDLRAHPITDFSYSLAAAGSIEPAPGGPQIGAHRINPGATIENLPYPARYAAEINAQIDLPGEFSQVQGNGVPGNDDAPSNGQPVTSQLTYDTQGPAPGGSSANAGGGGGGASGNNPCATLHPPQSCFPVAQIRRRREGAAAARVSSWDAATPAHAARARAKQADASACPSAGLSTDALYLGGLSLQNVSLTCDPTARYPWTGTANLDFHELPGGDALPNADITLKLDGAGRFAGGEATLGPFSPGLPLFTTPPVSLDSLGIGIGVHPTDFVGQASVDILDGLVDISGGVLVANADSVDPYTYDSTSCEQGLQCPPLPGVGSLQWRGPITTFAAGVGGTVSIGDVPVLGTIQLASGYVFYIYPSYLEFAGHLGPIALGPVSASADLRGAFDTSKGQYDASGDVRGCMDWPLYGNTCIQLAGEVSNVGVGACVGGQKAGGCSPVCVGFTYTWSGSFNLNVALRGDGCDFGPIAVQVGSVRRAAAAQPGGSVAFDLPRGLPGADVYVHGSGAPPRIELSGPHGERLSDPVAGQGARLRDLMLWPLPQLDETLIAIANPPAGRWTVTPLAGSPPITELAYARQLPSVRIAAVVSGRGRTLTLRYHVRDAAGRTIELVERGRGVFHVLGRAGAGHGTLRFAPALGPAGEREIVAVIAEGGVPVAAHVVGSYRAPAIPRAGRARRLRIVRRAQTLQITWQAAAGARAYMVAANLSDGRRLSYSTRARTITIRTFAPGTGALVRLYALGPTGVPGPAASARLAPPAPPARVTRITVRRTRTGLVISWRHAARAVRYMLKLTISGATSASLFAITDRPALALLKDASLMLARGASTVIQIRAVSLEGQQGPPGTIYFRAKGKRRHPRHGQRLELFA
jgi:hypothetical protein